MKTWKITGFIATLVIVLAFPAYLLKEKYARPSDRPEEGSVYVGAEKCRDCHKQEYDKWRDSHHDKSMDLATEESVLGDFNDTVFEHSGVVSRFYRRDGTFFVCTQGPEGSMGDFEITHTFGYYPLQQYLVPFPGGRLQCLPIAWDAKEEKWFSLYPDDPPNPNEWIYWTNSGQCWNSMCAECHSTNLGKGYNPDTDTYGTTWSEIDVSCEACHGPSSRHVAWAEMPEMARPQTHNYGLAVRTSGLSSRDYVELCAPCHSRRRLIQQYSHTAENLLDTMAPQLLSQDMYFPDGQILEEVYVYGSFIQSKMYHRDVRCGDCHDAHSIKLVKEGNELCLQCHRRDIYDTYDHHFHKKKGQEGEPIRSAEGEVLFEVGTGAECVQCHMPGRYYMVIDYRPDHSLRIPRPDLSITLGTPNACNRCHIDKSNEWSADYMTKWYGERSKPHYGAILAAGRKRQPDAEAELARLAGDSLFPVIVRSTALALLSEYTGEDSNRAFEMALADEDALIRQTALMNFHPTDPQKDLKRVFPMLYDPVKAVRIEAAHVLTQFPRSMLTPEQDELLQRTLREYEQALLYSADFAYAHYNLGNMYTNLGQFEKAEEHFREAIRIENDFYPAKVNLSMLYNRMGRNREAESLLREVVQRHPELYEVQYSLGLLLAEEKEYVEAVKYLATAARGIPNRSRIHYNLGLLLDYLQRDVEAEKALLTAVRLESDNLDYLTAVADYYLKRKRYAEAGEIARQMAEKHPANPAGTQVLKFIKRARQSP